MVRWGIVLLIIGSAGASAEPDDQAALRERLDRLEQEVLNLKAESARTAPEARPEPEPAPQTPPTPPAATARPAIESVRHLGRAASKIYVSGDSDWTFAMDADLLSYGLRNGSTDGVAHPNRANVARLSPTIGFRVHPRVLVNTQFSFESGGAERSDTVTLRKGQAVVRLAYLDWLASDKSTAGLRVGHQFVPVGQVNSRDESRSYFGVIPSEVESRLLLATWHENGALAWMERGGLELQAGIFNSLNSADMRGPTFLGGGRSQGQNAPADDLMGAFRLQARYREIVMGLSGAFGNSAQKQASVRGGNFDLGEAHVGLELARFQALAVAARGHLRDADAISIVNSTSLATTARGHYVQAAFDVLGGDRKLWIFARHSKINLNDQMPEGHAADPLLSRSTVTAGLSYWPLPELTLKADYSAVRAADRSREDQVNFGLSVVY